MSSTNGPLLGSDAQSQSFGVNTSLPAAPTFSVPSALDNFSGTISGANILTALDGIYATEPIGILNNWYKALPYGFIFTSRSGVATTIYLPISPNNISIGTHFSTHVIPTLYGTIEQHSDQRYFDIKIEGTTGIAPRFAYPITGQQKPSDAAKGCGRAAFSVQESIPSNVLGGFFAKTIAASNQILNKAADILNPQSNSSGIDIGTTGYAAFHRLQKFFLLYKKDTSGQLDTGERLLDNVHPLMFINYKDNVRYDCSIQKFDVRKSAENPMLYNYSIVLRAYNIATLSSSPAAVSDMKQRLKDLGLDGINNSTIFSKLKNLTSNAKSIFGAASGGLNILGS